MQTFRMILREAMRLLRASVAAAGRLATAPFRAFDDAAELSARVLAMLFRPAPVAADDDVQDAIEDEYSDRGLEQTEEARRLIGSYARRAAEERLAHGVVVSPDIPLAVRSWVSVLPRDSLRALVASDDVTVGRHIAGETVIRDNIGGILPRPDPVADEAAYRVRLAERERREKAYDQASRSARVPRPLPTPSLVPTF